MLGKKLAMSDFGLEVCCDHTVTQSLQALLFLTINNAGYRKRNGRPFSIVLRHGYDLLYINQSVFERLP